MLATENMNPTTTGRLPPCINFRVALSIAANVVRIDRVTKSKGVGEKCRSQQQGILAESEECPTPCRQIEDQQYAEYGDCSRSGVLRLVVDQRLQKG
jgi:hypothetical protein